MVKNLRYLIAFVTVIFFAIQSSGQLVFEQDIVKGGITAAGFSTGQGFGSGSFDIFIESGSSIKKAYAYTYSQRYPPPAEFTLNELSFSFDTNNVIMNVGYYDPPAPFVSPSRLYFTNLTNEINPDISNYNVTIPLQPDLPINAGYWTFFLIVVYEHPELNHTAYSILINDKNFTGLEIYNVDQLNPTQTNYPVGFSLYTDRSGLGTPPNKLVTFNSALLGVVGGSDNVNSNWNRGGVKGHFYYQNNQLFGLDDDLPNNVMSGTDGLADVSEYLLQNATNINFQIQHSNYPNQPITGTQVNLAYTLAYTTPCQPFETTLTEEVTLCRGDSAHLLATGGTSTGSGPAYEWLPQEDLSCYDCPNPVFVGDSTRHYTVRIWNTDSCSKVLPVKVLVYDAPTQANLNINPATCSESNGSMSISNVQGGTPQYIYNIGGNNTTNPNFNNLAPGVYNLQITDANTCTYNQAFTIEEINPVTAAYSANPQQGVAPLNVNFTNQSAGANLYQWIVNTQTFESFNLNYTFDTAGVYPVQLIATYNEPHCADTTQKVIVVENAFSAIIPTLHAGSQGFWRIQTTNVTHAKVQIYNAIGQLIHQTEQAVGNGPNALWNATGKATGYYFYRIQLTDVEGNEFDYKGKVLVVN